MAQFILIHDFPFGGGLLKAGTLLADETGDPIAALQAEGAVLAPRTAALEELGRRLLQSSVPSDARQIMLETARADTLLLPKWRRNESPCFHGGDLAPIDETSERAQHVAESDETVISAQWVGSANVVGNDVNNATILLRRRDGVGGGAVTIASFTTDVASGGFTAFQPKSIGPLANVVLAAGSILTFEITKVGTGVAIPPGLLSVIVDIDE